MTAHIVRSSRTPQETTGSDDPSSRRSTWEIRIAGRTFAYDDAGLAKLGAALLRMADTNRRPKPPQVTEIHLVIRADPAAPYDVIRSLLERAGGAGFYKFSFGESVPTPFVPGSESTSRRDSGRPDPPTMAAPTEIERRLVPEPELDPRPNGRPLPRTVFIRMDEAKKQFDLAVQLFDARSKAVFEAAHIKGAVNLDATDPALVAPRSVPPALDRFDRAKTVVVYDDGGDCDAAQLISIQLRKFGFTDVKVFEEGFAAWKSNGHPVEATR